MNIATWERITDPRFQVIYHFIIIFTITLINSQLPPEFRSWTNFTNAFHYNGVIMSTKASQITGVSIVCSTDGSDADQGKYQSSASLAFVQVTGEFPAQKASNTENVYIWWRHHG